MRSDLGSTVSTVSAVRGYAVLCALHFAISFVGRISHFDARDTKCAPIGGDQHPTHVAMAHAAHTALYVLESSLFDLSCYFFRIHKGIVIPNPAKLDPLH